LKTAIEKDANDKTNKPDSDLMETVYYQQRMIDKFASGEDQDTEKCANYCKSILETCTHSVEHICKRIEMLLKSLQLPQAKEFSQEQMRRSEMANNPKIMAWHGRVLIYSGADVKGK